VVNRPVISRKSIATGPVSNEELTVALEYAKQDRQARKRRRHDTKDPQRYVGRELDKNLLRILANTALQRWINETGRKVILPLIAANVVREAVPQFPGSLVEVDQLYQAYKCAVMKIMSIRRVWQMKRDAEKHKRGEPVPERIKQTEHPAETKPGQERQLRLFS